MRKAAAAGEEVTDKVRQRRLAGARPQDLRFRAPRKAPPLVLLDHLDHPQVTFRKSLQLLLAMATQSKPILAKMGDRLFNLETGPKGVKLLYNLTITGTAGKCGIGLKKKRTFPS
ncbi:unnamed protein product [Pylaiella littoralis]